MKKFNISEATLLESNIFEPIFILAAISILIFFLSRKLILLFFFIQIPFHEL